MRYLSFFLCLKYLSRKKIVLLSVAAVAMSCALLIVVSSLFIGFIASFEAGIKEHTGDIVMTSTRGVKIGRYDELIARLEESGVVESATGVLSSHGGLLFLGAGNVRAVKVLGIEMPRRAEVLPFADALVRQKGSGVEAQFALDDVNDAAGGFVGIGVLAFPDEVTDEYDMQAVESFIGKKVGLTAGGQSSESAALLKFTVTDVVYSGFHMADKDFIYLPIETVTKKFFPESGRIADIIQIKLSPDVDPAVAVPVVRGIWQDFASKELNWNSYLVSLVRVETSRKKWAPLISEYHKQMKMLMLIFGIVSGGVVLLISCIFYAIVLTKRKDIAVVKSCGLGAGSVTVLFIFFGLITGFAGSVLGVGMGYYITKNVNWIEQMISIAFGLKLWKSSTYMFSKIPSQVDWESAMWIACIAVIAAGIGALVPAVVAARLRPVEILRYE